MGGWGGRGHESTRQTLDATLHLSLWTLMDALVVQRFIYITYCLPVHQHVILHWWYVVFKLIPEYEIKSVLLQVMVLFILLYGAFWFCCVVKKYPE